MKKYKEITISVDAMDYISRSLGLWNIEVFCGYLRQPIKAIQFVNDEGKNTYRISGQCCLNEMYCQRYVSTNQHWIVDQCEKYTKIKNETEK